VPALVITQPLPFKELAAIFADTGFEGLLVAGVHDPDPLTWIRELRTLHPGRSLPIAILHSADELTESAVALASSRLRVLHQDATVRPFRRSVFIDQPGRELRVNGKGLKCSPIEFRILLFLIRHAGIVFSRLELLHRTRAVGRRVDPRIVDVLIARLRAKIDGDHAENSHLIAIRELGYRFDRNSDVFVDVLTGGPFESWPSLLVPSESQSVQ